MMVLQAGDQMRPGRSIDSYTRRPLRASYATDVAGSQRPTAIAQLPNDTPPGRANCPSSWSMTIRSSARRSGALRAAGLTSTRSAPPRFLEGSFAAEPVSGAGPPSAGSGRHGAAPPPEGKTRESGRIRGGFGDIPTSVAASPAPSTSSQAGDGGSLIGLRGRGAGQLQAPRGGRAGRISANGTSLTPREREVLRLVVSGRLNKRSRGSQDLRKTVKVHRGRVMQKMGTRRVEELVPSLCAWASKSPATAPESLQQRVEA